MVLSAARIQYSPLNEILELLNQFNLFKNIPSDSLRQLADRLTYVKFNSGENLLTQGQNNTRIYILIQGEAVIRSNGIILGKVSWPGDLIGERSVISQKPSGTTVEAGDNLEAYELDARSLFESSDSELAVLQKHLYRLCAQNLIKSLDESEQLVRKTEEANLHLEQIREELRSINKELETEVLTSANLSPETHKAEVFVGRAIEAMQSKRVILAESDRKRQAMARLALGGLGASLEIGDSRDAALKAIGRGVDILFVEAEMLDLARDAVAANPNCKIVLMTSDYVPNYLPDLLKLDFIPNIVSGCEDDRPFTIKNLGTTATKLISNDLFGLEKYLAWGTEVTELPVIRSDQRSFLISQMDRDLESLGVRRTTRGRMSTVTEELLMNAIYDAPVGADGQSLYNHFSRTKFVQLNPEQQGRLRYASDGVFAALSVEDPFGALSGSTILKYLQSCYSGKAGEMNHSKGGAGRGLHQIVENSDLVVFNLSPGKRTEVIAIFNVDPRTNPIEYPTFHLFTA